MKFERSVGSALQPGDRQVEKLMPLIREMEEGHDLDGLATVASIALSKLRYLCERPATCAELDSMLAALEGLKPHLKMPED